MFFSHLVFFKSLSPVHRDCVCLESNNLQSVGHLELKCVRDLLLLPPTMDSEGIIYHRIQQTFFLYFRQQCV